MQQNGIVGRVPSRRRAIRDPIRARASLNFSSLRLGLSIFCQLAVDVRCDFVEERNLAGCFCEKVSVNRSVALTQWTFCSFTHQRTALCRRGYPDGAGIWRSAGPNPAPFSILEENTVVQKIIDNVEKKKKRRSRRVMCKVQWPALQDIFWCWRRDVSDRGQPGGCPPPGQPIAGPKWAPHRRICGRRVARCSTIHTDIRSCHCFDKLLHC